MDIRRDLNSCGERRMGTRDRYGDGDGGKILNRNGGRGYVPTHRYSLPSLSMNSFESQPALTIATFDQRKTKILAESGHDVTMKFSNIPHNIKKFLNSNV